ncbi:hypothetical protein B0T10DRAFT_584810 [Thelonectria olida]|uniref:Uncharacterized protein n=1 Tax=Thelonectria olida TaxID=1576542 RepID=A0A9P8VWZ9_9HYPO|nr:hypothetical protein B0T10DRAFT_584810 [Thelonectria olida]
MRFTVSYVTNTLLGNQPDSPFKAIRLGCRTRRAAMPQNLEARYNLVTRWPHLRNEAAVEDSAAGVQETVLLGATGQRLTYLQAYPFRGKVLEGLAIYDYMSLVMLKRKGRGVAGWGEVEFDSSCPYSSSWVQVLRRPGEQAVVVFDGYLSMDFAETDDTYHKREKACLPRRVLFLVDNVQPLRRSAEDVKIDAKQWAAESGEGGLAGDSLDPAAVVEGEEAAYDGYHPDNVASAVCLVDVFRGALREKEVTSGSLEISRVVRRLSWFQEVALGSADELRAAAQPEGEIRKIAVFDGHALIPRQSSLRAIKS